MMRKRAATLLNQHPWGRELNKAKAKSDTELKRKFKTLRESNLEAYDHAMAARIARERAYFKMLFHVEKKLLDELISTDTLGHWMYYQRGLILRLHQRVEHLRAAVSSVSESEESSQRAGYLQRMLIATESKEAAARGEFQRRVERMV